MAKRIPVIHVTSDERWYATSGIWTYTNDYATRRELIARLNELGWPHV